ncbi:hypothetical protein OJF2_78990 (plasmid) [Aquisphaera giovannonii]|uniref:Uncharacterized protein n=1 Tax=Aquisphaera giovannonii TaxID=406548 RepID=A0A5B9WGI2_9BACT|nr:hypothetical protein OJF2_78990 [Aquisphaera giovannonii]
MDTSEFSDKTSLKSRHPLAEVADFFLIVPVCRRRGPRVVFLASRNHTNEHPKST